ncbi:hypothetical protein Peur_059852 [Populus x canadensis]
MAIFSKSLTKTDIEKRLSFPTKCLRSLPCFGRGHAVDFHVMDECGQVWTFRCTIRKKNNPKPVISKDWSKFVSSKDLAVGDKITFSKLENKVGCAFYKIEVKKPVKLFGVNVGY